MPCRETLQGTGIGNDFQTRSPVAQERIARIDKWDCTRLKSFYTAKETISRVKREPTEWGKIFASYSLRGLICRMYKELKKIKYQKDKIQSIDKQMNRQLKNKLKNGQ
jgi:hypothetical protein